MPAAGRTGRQREGASAGFGLGSALPRGGRGSGKRAVGDAMICFRPPPPTQAVGKVVMGSESVAQAVAYMAEMVHEEMHVLVLDARNRIRLDYMACRGWGSGCDIDPPSILRAVLLTGFSRFVIVHNHPSGSPLFSPEDMRFTRKAVDAAKCAGVRLLDSLVVATDPESGRLVHASMRGYGDIDFDNA